MQGLAKVTILNLSGQTLSQTALSLIDGRFEVKMKHLNAGLYIIRVSNDKIQQTLKVLKN
jgi:hypothetical protein